jgi:chemotaxis regulatin CheY-phosphate phosphatase CheZ
MGAAAQAFQVRPNVQFVVPPIAVWDGKTPTRRAHTFIKEIERLASFTAQASYDIIMAHLAPDFQDNLEQVSQQFGKDGTGFTWELAKKAFVAL